MTIDEKKDILRAVADGRLTELDKAVVRELGKVLGVTVKRGRCKSCWRDAAVEIYARLQEPSSVEPEPSEPSVSFGLVRPVNFNGVVYGTNTPSAVVERLLRNGLPVWYIRKVEVGEK